MQRHGDGDAIGRGGDADLVVGGRDLDGEADDLPRRRQPLHHQRQRERQHLRRLQGGNVERGASPRRSATPRTSANSSAAGRSGCPALRAPARPRRSAACPRSRREGRRGHSARCLSPPGAGVAILVIASLRRAGICGPRCRDRTRCGLPHLRPAPPRIPRLARARRRGPAIARSASARRGGSGPAAPANCLRPETAPAVRKVSRAGSSVRGRASSSAPRTTLRNCSSTKVATLVSSPRSMARSNSRISSACACGGSCAR